MRACWRKAKLIELLRNVFWEFPQHQLQGLCVTEQHWILRRKPESLIRYFSHVNFVVWAKFIVLIIRIFLLVKIYRMSVLIGWRSLASTCLQASVNMESELANSLGRDLLHFYKFSMMKQSHSVIKKTFMASLKWNKLLLGFSARKQSSKSWEILY
jgi:hypothetical protein